MLPGTDVGSPETTRRTEGGRAPKTREGSLSGRSSRPTLVPGPRVEGRRADGESVVTGGKGFGVVGKDPRPSAHEVDSGTS